MEPTLEEIARLFHERIAATRPNPPPLPCTVQDCAGRQLPSLLRFEAGEPSNVVQFRPRRLGGLT